MILNEFIKSLLLNETVVSSKLQIKEFSFIKKVKKYAQLTNISFFKN